MYHRVVPTHVVYTLLRHKMHYTHIRFRSLALLCDSSRLRVDPPFTGSFQPFTF